MSVNRTDLVAAIADKAGLKKTEADAALSALQDVLVESLTKGEAVKVTGLLSVERVERAARTGRNPRTGATVRIRKTSVPKFRAGAQFKEYVAAPSKLPKSGLVGQRAAAGTAKKAAAKTAAKKTAKKEEEKAE